MSNINTLDLSLIIELEDYGTAANLLESLKKASLTIDATSKKMTDSVPEDGLKDGDLYTLYILRAKISGACTTIIKEHLKKVNDAIIKEISKKPGQSLTYTTTFTSYPLQPSILPTLILW